ncbi:TRAP transporter solute receptor [Vibrio maritimus]|uniref:TRAP transporter solute receptor n=1 Tax=Vibrio maritimus TaxID=990268 RepID=A0A090T2P9_9VIBR|nr:TRAP transporter solute receptor [Vibrio maritimus]
MYTQALHENANSWSKMSSEYPDIKVRSFPPEVINALKQANGELLKQQASKDELAKEILDSQASYLNKMREWTNISLQAYLNEQTN